MLLVVEGVDGAGEFPGDVSGVFPATPFTVDMPVPPRASRPSPVPAMVPLAKSLATLRCVGRN